jgi:hypothetical protein
MYYVTPLFIIGTLCGHLLKLHLALQISFSEYYNLGSEFIFLDLYASYLTLKKKSCVVISLLFIIITFVCEVIHKMTQSLIRIGSAWTSFRSIYKIQTVVKEKYILELCCVKQMTNWKTRKNTRKINTYIHWWVYEYSLYCCFIASIKETSGCLTIMWTGISGVITPHNLLNVSPPKGKYILYFYTYTCSMYKNKDILTVKTLI